MRSKDLAVIAMLVLSITPRAIAAEVTPWPPSDPAQPRARVAITMALVMSLRDIRDFASLQRAVGSSGKLSSVDNDLETPRAIYDWEGLGGRGRMTVDLYRTGGIGVTITPDDGTKAITLNNAGAFICPDCSPPVDACGHRPSWVPHSVHWDTFDCHRTIIGPQTPEANSR